jgi:transposase InsO family protein
MHLSICIGGTIKKSGKRNFALDFRLESAQLVVDKGCCHYTSIKFQQLLWQFKIKQSMSLRG